MGMVRVMEDIAVVDMEDMVVLLVLGVAMEGVTAAMEVRSMEIEAMVVAAAGVEGITRTEGREYLSDDYLQ